MSSSLMPTLFVSHGSPMIMLEQSPARDFLESLVQSLPRPKAILIASAHFETTEPALSADASPQMIYDFGGFPRPLFEMTYPAPGSPALAQQAVELLTAAGIKAGAKTNRGYDHGTWTPLKLMFPQADIPIVQISIQTHSDPTHHIAMGRALSPLREQGVLIMGSGTLTHNLYAFMQVRNQPHYPTPDWVSGFGNWVQKVAESGDVEAMVRYRQEAPYFKENHPSDDHFLPFPFAMGAAGQGAKGQRIHTSAQSGVMLMDAYRFD